MKKLKAIFVCLSLCVATLIISSCGSSLFGNNSQKLESEINSLKNELNAQSALISSLISKSTSVKNDADNKPAVDDTDKSSNNNNNDSSSRNQNNSSSDFEYTSDEKGITLTKYKGNMKSVKIPEKIDGKPIIRIGKRTFAETEIKSVSLPSCLEYIDWFAFYGCYSLETVYVPEKVSEIGYAAFDGCSKRLTLYSSSGSYAEKFAKSFGITFVAIS